MFSLPEFKKASRLDRIFMHMMDAELYRLKHSEIQYLEDMKKAFVVMRTCLSQLQLVKKMEELYTVDGKRTRKTNWIYSLINDTKALFGSFLEENAVFDRMTLQRRYQELADKARELGDLKEERLTLDSLSKLLPPPPPEDYEGFSLEEIDLPKIVISADPKLLDIEEAEIVINEEE